MTSDQKHIVDTYSAFSVTMFVVVVAWGILYKVYSGLQQFYHGMNPFVNVSVFICFSSLCC